MKIRLLNDGGYGDMENVNFPVVVEAERYPHFVAVYTVRGSELRDIGGTGFDDDLDYDFMIVTDYEVVENAE